jgi:hypothetical protein
MANQFTTAKLAREKHSQSTRDKIKAAQIINRLYACVMGKVEMTPQQVASAKTLLGKVLPDLQATQVTGEVTHNYALMPEEAMTAEEWQQQHAPPTIN